MNLQSITTLGGRHPAVFGDSFISEVLHGEEDSQDPNPDHDEDISP
jgi:hypothetical protein